MQFTKCVNVNDINADGFYLASIRLLLCEIEM